MSLSIMDTVLNVETDHDNWNVDMELQTMLLINFTSSSTSNILTGPIQWQLQMVVLYMQWEDTITVEAVVNNKWNQLNFSNVWYVKKILFLIFSVQDSNSEFCLRVEEPSGYKEAIAGSQNKNWKRSNGQLNNIVKRE